MKRKYLIIILFVLAIALMALGLLLWRRDIFHPPGIAIDKQRYPVTGIDISRHTGRVDFHRAAKDDIHFVYMKATEGASHIDPLFEANYRKASAAGLPVGAYHFFRFRSDGKEQARLFLDRLKGKSMHLPHVVDVEAWGNDRGEHAVRKKVVANLQAFITEVERATGKRPLIYTNGDGYRNYIRGHFDRHGLWICAFREPLDIPGWILWQHSHGGRFDWAEGVVDINTFQGNMSDWEAWLAKKG